MKFTGISMIDVSEIGLTQLYLSQNKLNKILSWFDHETSNFEPVYVHEYGGGLHLTDGHTRTFAAWKNGVVRIPCIYDESEIVTCPIGEIQYNIDVEWCERFGVRHVSDLQNRILSKEDYEELWMGRCERMYILETALLEGRINREVFEKIKQDLLNKGYFVYGVCHDFKTLCFENCAGNLFEAPYEEL